MTENTQVVEVNSNGEVLTSDAPAVVSSDVPVVVSSDVPVVVASDAPVASDEPVVVASDEPVVVASDAPVASDVPVASYAPAVVSSDVPVLENGTVLAQIHKVDEGVRKLAGPFSAIKKLIPFMDVLRTVYQEWFKLTEMFEQASHQTDAVSDDSANLQVNGADANTAEAA